MASFDTHEEEMSAQHLFLALQQLIISPHAAVRLLEKPWGGLSPVNKSTLDELRQK